jgi:rSAM-associated Gly-rich repeat protein
MNFEPEKRQDTTRVRTLAKSLGALFALGSGLIFGSASDAGAADAKSLSPSGGATGQLEARVQKIQQQLGQALQGEVQQGDGTSDQMQTMQWWANWHNWHPGSGWGNRWHPGWGNGGWGNGGWHNWHNWHNWGNY